jgi:hypothetical protein
MQGNFATLGCASAADTACLCAIQSFKDGVDDCADQHCVPPAGSTEDAALVKAYAVNFCAGGFASGCHVSFSELTVSSRNHNFNCCHKCPGRSSHNDRGTCRAGGNQC